jgi:DNA-binding IclR family transcriptional regulator
MAKPEDQILQLLKVEDALTLNEIAEKLDKTPKVVFKLLRKLFESNKISFDAKTRRYSLSKEVET